jgi:outer membrane receptor protein involved in Fe transport
MRPIRPALLLVLLTSVLRAGEAPSSATGDQDPAAALAELPLEALLATPVEFVSGVSNYEQSIRRAPAGVTVLTAAEIRAQGWRTLAEALRSAPGMHVRHDRFYHYLGNRGFTRPLDYNSRTLLLVDGHRMNDSIYQQGSIGDDFILDLDMVERIEIVRGPGSSIYGGSAQYGTINVIPKRGRDLGGGQVGLTAGSEPSGKARVSVGERLENGLDYAVSATVGESRGETEFTLPQSWRDRAPGVFTEQVARDQDDTRTAQLYGRAAWRGLAFESAYSRREKEVLPPVYFTPVDSLAQGNDERAYALFRVDGEPRADAALSAKVALDYYRYTGRFEPVSTGFETQRPMAEAVSLSGELRWRQTLAGRHVWLSGVEYQENLRQELERTNLTTGEVPVQVSETSRQISPFTQLEAELGQGWWLTLGARFDAHSAYEDRLSPRAGLIWEAGADTTLKVLFGEAFRVPNVEERYAGEAGVVPNPELKPETSRTYEVLLERRLGPRWTVDASLYQVESEDLIVALPVGPAPTDPLSNTNAQAYLTRGGDLGFSARWASGATLRGSATYQRTHDDATGKTVVDAPRVLGKLNASTPLGPRWLRAGAELQYVAERREVGGTTVADYVVANLTLRAVQLGEGWELGLTIHNVADATWEDPKNVGVIAAPPRAVTVRATRDF